VITQLPLGTGYYVMSLSTDGKTAFIGGGDTGALNPVIIVDVTNPAKPTKTSFISL